MATKKIDTVISQPSIRNLLGNEELYLPPFQRHYSWGSAGKEHKAKAYFLEYLCNRNAIDFFGLIIVHSLTRHDFESDLKCKVGLADGQHRLCTLVMGCIAVYEALCAATEHAHKGTAAQAQRMLDEYAQDFAVICSTPLEIRLEAGQPAVSLVGFLKDRAATLRELELERQALEAAHKAKIEHLKATASKGERRPARSSLTQDRKQALKQLYERKKELEATPAWQAYRSIKQVLVEDQGDDFFESLSYCRQFLERLEEYSVSLTAFVPKRPRSVTLAELEAESFEAFAGLNSTTNPLLPGH